MFEEMFRIEGRGGDRISNVAFVSDRVRPIVKHGDRRAGGKLGRRSQDVWMTQQIESELHVVGGERHPVLPRDVQRRRIVHVR